MVPTATRCSLRVCSGTLGQQHLRDGSSPRRPDQQYLCHCGALGEQHLPDVSSLQRPCQQQTSSGGEEYSGLASNLAHLGRIC